MDVVTSDATGATVTLTRSELSLIKNAIFYVCYEESGPVEEWEFPTRMEGLERVDAILFAQRIRDLLAQSLG
jgi:hypothetical protein